MTHFKTIYVDIMVDGYFYKQVSFTHNEAFPIFQSQLRELVLSKYPSLENKQFTIELSNQRIIGN